MTPPEVQCRLGRIEYDGARYCHEHGGFLEPGIQSARCDLAPCLRCGFDPRLFEPRPEKQRGAARWHAALHEVGDSTVTAPEVPMCPASSPESSQPCVLPDSRDAHRAGHESARVGIVRAVWATTEAERERWAAGAEERAR